MARTRTFEDIRDNYFINPGAGDNIGMAKGLQLGIEALAAKRPIDDSIDSSIEPPLSSVVREMVEDFSGARYFDNKSVAQLHPSGNVPAILAHNFSTFMNNNTIVEEVGPVEVPYERGSIDWMNENIARYDTNRASGLLTSGGTSANLTSQLIARTQLECDGWRGDEPVVILANEMAHYSIKKAARLLFPRGMAEVKKVPLKSDTLKIDTDQLAEMVKSHREMGRRILSIIGVAGETETGLVENLKEIAEIAKENNIFYHVDGAYGAPFVLSKQAALFEGMSEADTITCDPHKYLYTPYNVGALLIKNSKMHGYLGEMNDDGNEYMHNKNGDNLGSMRIEGSMGGQGASSVHWTIKTLGADGLRELYNHTIDVTNAFSERIEEKGIMRNAFNPELNTACVVPVNYTPQEILVDGKPHDPNFTKTEQCLAKAGIYLSTTKFPVADPATGKVQDQRVFRFVATHPHTSKRDAEDIADILSNSWLESNRE